MVGPFEQSGEEIMCLAVFQSGETLQSVQIDGFFPRISHISSDLDKFDTNNNPIQLIQDYIYIDKVKQPSTSSSVLSRDEVGHPAG